MKQIATIVLLSIVSISVTVAAKTEIPYDKFQRQVPSRSQDRQGT
jgi:hypothetical protein